MEKWREKNHFFLYISSQTISTSQMLQDQLNSIFSCFLDALNTVQAIKDHIEKYDVPPIAWSLNRMVLIWWCPSCSTLFMSILIREYENGLMYYNKISTLSLSNRNFKNNIRFFHERWIQELYALLFSLKIWKYIQCL